MRQVTISKSYWHLRYPVNIPQQYFDPRNMQTGDWANVIINHLIPYFNELTPPFSMLCICVTEQLIIHILLLGISCDVDDPPAYTTRESDANAVGDQVVYTCSNDTWFAPGTDQMVFECLSSGEWFPPLRPCECKYINIIQIIVVRLTGKLTCIVYTVGWHQWKRECKMEAARNIKNHSIYTFSVTVTRCDPPPSLTMGQLDTTVTLFGSSITYSCMYGFIFPDGAISKTITCTGDPPTWGPQSEIDSLNCTRKMTRITPERVNNKISCASSSF